MPRSNAQRVKRLFIAMALVAVLMVLLHVMLSRFVHYKIRDRIETLAAKCGARWMQAERTTITIDLLQGNVRIDGLYWEPDTSAESGSLAASGKLDSLDLRGISYSALLFHRRFAADHLAVFTAELDLRLSGDTSTTATIDREPLDVRTETLQVQLRNTRVVLAGGTRIELSDLRSDGIGVQLDMNIAEFVASEFHVSLSELRASPVADSALTIAAMALDGVTGDAFLERVTFGPAEPVAKARTLDVERDVVAGTVDRLAFRGMDMDALLRGTPTFRAVQVGHTRLTVARDKVLRDPPFKHKALPAGLLRALPLGAGADSIIVEHLRMDYHERVDVARGFAHIPFDSIAGLLLGTRHAPGDTMILEATGSVFGRTPIALDLRTHAGDSSDLFVAEARVGYLAFAQLTNVLAPLTGVATPEGRLDTLILRMNGRDAGANARCWMRYDGLKLDRRGKKNKLLDPVFEGLMNAIVKRARTGEKEGDGWESYSWERRRDRSVFNYLWAGVREGAKASMLPKAVVEQVSKR